MSISLDDMIVLIQAHKDGKQIEFRRPDAVDNSWKPYDLTRELARGFELRIKPKPREFWIRMYEHGGVIFPDKGSAECDGVTIVHVREVLPG